MTEEVIKPLFQISDKVIAEEVKRILEEEGIFSLLSSDDPAESVMNTYFGSAFKGNYTLQVNGDDYLKARTITEESGYGDFLME